MAGYQVVVGVGDRASKSVEQERVRGLEVRLREFEERFAQISDHATQVAWVVSETEEHFLLSFGSAVMAANKPKFRLEPGDAVRVVPQTMQVLDKIDVPACGQACRVAKVLDGGLCEVDVGAERRIALVGCCELEEGDRVLLDRSGQVCLRLLPPEHSPLAISKAICWDDVGGHAEAKRELIDAVETPYKHPSVYARYGQRPVRGVLLHGPSGCGKSYLGRAVATAVAAPHGGKGAESAFIYVKGPEVVDKWVGSSEANVRSLFDQARRHKRAYGYPAVIFIDEAEAVLGHRGGGLRLSSGETMSSTLVPAFLAEMDGLEDSAAFVLLATNLPAALDSAVVRDGRIDRKIRVGRPDRRDAGEIFALHLRGKPGQVDAIVEAGVAALYDRARVLFHLEMQGGVRFPVALCELASGAMIEGVVARATQSAIRRELDSGKRGGLTVADVLGAVDQVERESAGLDHSAMLEESGRDMSRLRAIRRANEVA